MGYWTQAGATAARKSRESGGSGKLRDEPTIIIGKQGEIKTQTKTKSGFETKTVSPSDYTIIKKPDKSFVVRTGTGKESVDTTLNKEIGQKAFEAAQRTGTTAGSPSSEERFRQARISQEQQRMLQTTPTSRDIINRGVRFDEEQAGQLTKGEADYPIIFYKGYYLKDEGQPREKFGALGMLEASTSGMTGQVLAVKKYKEEQRNLGIAKEQVAKSSIITMPYGVYLETKRKFKESGAQKKVTDSGAYKFVDKYGIQVVKKADKDISRDFVQPGMNWLGNVNTKVSSFVGKKTGLKFIEEQKPLYRAGLEKLSPKTAEFSAGVGSGIRKDIIEKPVSNLLLFAASFGTGYGVKAASTAYKGVATGIKVTGIIGGTIYAGTTAYGTATQPTPELAGKYLGGKLSKAGIIIAGSTIGAAAYTPKITTTYDPNKLSGRSLTKAEQQQLIKEGAYSRKEVGELFGKSGLKTYDKAMVQFQQKMQPTNTEYYYQPGKAKIPVPGQVYGKLAQTQLRPGLPPQPKISQSTVPGTMRQPGSIQEALRATYGGSVVSPEKIGAITQVKVLAYKMPSSTTWTSYKAPVSVTLSPTKFVYQRELIDYTWTSYKAPVSVTLSPTKISSGARTKGGFIFNKKASLSIGQFKEHVGTGFYKINTANILNRPEPFISSISPGGSLKGFGGVSFLPGTSVGGLMIAPSTGLRTGLSLLPILSVGVKQAGLQIVAPSLDVRKVPITKTSDPFQISVQKVKTVQKQEIDQVIKPEQLTSSEKVSVQKFYFFQPPSFVSEPLPAREFTPIIFPMFIPPVKPPTIIGGGSDWLGGLYGDEPKKKKKKVKRGFRYTPSLAGLAWGLKQTKQQKKLASLTGILPRGL